MTQAQTGGNVADVLHRPSRLLRDRAKLKALSAEGRMSAWFLSAMPIVLFFATRLLAPQYFAEAEQSGAFKSAPAYGLGSLVIANYFIFRMVNFKI